MPHLTACRALEYRWDLSCLLSTLLHIPCRLSRVPYGRLKQDDVGGAIVKLSPSALCGSPDVAWGKNQGLSMRSSTGLRGNPVSSITSVDNVSVGLAGIIGKVCQGHSSPKDFMRFM